MMTKSPVRGMDVDFAEGDIYITTFDGYFSHFKMSNPSSAVSFKNFLKMLG
jgi:hypothetical protein